MRPLLFIVRLAIINQFIFNKSNPNLPAFVIEAVCNRTRCLLKKWGNVFHKRVAHTSEWPTQASGPRKHQNAST